MKLASFLKHNFYKHFRYLNKGLTVDPTQFQTPVRDVGLVIENNVEVESLSIQLDIMPTSLANYEGRKLVSPFKLQMEPIESQES